VERHEVNTLRKQQPTSDACNDSDPGS